MEHATNGGGVTIQSYNFEHLLRLDNLVDGHSSSILCLT